MQHFSNHNDFVNFTNNCSNYVDAATLLFQHALYKIYKQYPISEKEGPISQVSELLEYLEHPFFGYYMKNRKSHKSFITYENNEATLPKLGNIYYCNCNLCRDTENQPIFVASLPTILRPRVNFTTQHDQALFRVIFKSGIALHYPLLITYI